MKKYFLLLTAFLTLSLFSFAQKYSSYAEAMRAGTSTNFSSEKEKIFSLAIKLAKKEKINPAEAYYQRALGYSKHEQKDKLKDISKAIKSDPKTYKYVRTMVLWNYDAKKSKKELEKYIANNPNHSLANFDMSNFIKKSDPHKSKTYLQKSYDLIISSKNSDKEYTAYSALKIVNADVLERGLNYYDKKALDKLLALQPYVGKNTNFTSTLAMAYFDNGMQSEALELVKTIKNNGNYWLQFFDGYKMYKNSDNKGALRILQKAEKNPLNHPVVQYYTGISWFNFSFYGKSKGWSYDKWKIRDRFKNVSKTAAGDYAYLAEEAKKQLAIMDKIKGDVPEWKSTTPEPGLDQFLVNFEQLPNYITSDNFSQGREITNLPYVKQHISNDRGIRVFAIGKIAETANHMAFIIFAKGENTYAFSVYAINKLGVEVPVYDKWLSSKDHLKKGSFTMEINGNSWTVTKMTQYIESGKSTKYRFTNSIK